MFQTIYLALTGRCLGFLVFDGNCNLIATVHTKRDAEFHASAGGSYRAAIIRKG